MTLFTFTDGLLFSLLSIVIVIALISLIILAITPLQRLNKTKVIAANHENQDSKLIVDDDMMVAALVAAIDYRETLNKEPYLKSIKEIENENI